MARTHARRLDALAAHRVLPNEPLEFEPGTKWKYNNSGYTLLGVIIEKVSGKKYEEFLTEVIFRPLGMERARYGSDAPIIPGRVEGYQRTPGGIINAPYLSMTHPYSAVLCRRSTTSPVGRPRSTAIVPSRRKAASACGRP